ncbi:MAG TPA: malto-oligosyltrehalose trehalohydrolase [Acidobacteriaceae bacterium]
MPETLIGESSQISQPLRSGVNRFHHISGGANVQPDGSVRFRIWAPAVSMMRLEIDNVDIVIPLRPMPNGWHELTTNEASIGSRYRFVLPDGTRVPDPASRFQPEDVHGPSEVIDPAAYRWSDLDWKGREWSEAVLYELHIGAFTPEGTFRAAIEKLDHLVHLGVTGIEIMPIADFPGKWNWGYDGALLYAPDSSYGRPEDLKALVEAAHARGLMVILDVVYNHFGPEGNFLPIYAPQTLTDRHKTGWGDAVNYDGDGSEAVREFVIHNALYWIEEFHLDGLRLDAVHAIKDDSSKHLLDELSERVRGAFTDRKVHLILENEDNQASRLCRDDAGRPIHYTAQWNDDVHHVLHTAATLESNGYYEDFNGDAEMLGRALTEGFCFQGQRMKCTGKERGEPSAHLPPTAFVAFMQNHDQIGNRAFGERIHAIASPEAVHAIASIYLLLPQIPMLFMGEEWGSSQPFPYFCDFKGDLGDKIRQGRRKEFANFPEFKDPYQQDRIPDPLLEETFLSAKLDWNQATTGVHAEWVNWYKRILAVRADRIAPVLDQIGGYAGSFHNIGTGAVVACWYVDDGRVLVLAANLSDKATRNFPNLDGDVFWQEGPEPVERTMKPWSVRWFFTRECGE